MRYKHTRFDDSVNVTHTHPLREFLGYLASILALIGLLFLFSGWIVELLIPHIDPKTEQWIWQKLLKDNYIQSEKATPRIAGMQAYLQHLLDRIPKENMPPGQYQVIVIDAPEVNALALPSGKIIVYTGLLDVLKSENAITFMLGHELGHFAHRDHLRGVGRSLIPAVILMPILGDDAAGALLSSTRLGYDRYFSRTQESEADAYGLQLLLARYHHAGGATELFDILKGSEQEPVLLGYFSTHPLSEWRIRQLQQTIAQQQMAVHNTEPKKINRLQ